MFLLATLPFINSFTCSNSNITDKLKNIIKHNGIIALSEIKTGKLIACTNLNLALKPHTIGSLAKLITATALLENKLITTNEKYNCNGYEIIDGKKVFCWDHSGHGNQNIESALANSCNLFFQHFARRITSKDIVKYYDLLNINVKQSLDTSISKEPLPDKIYGNKDQIVLGLNDELKFNVIQMLNFASTIARNGVYKPITTTNNDQKQKLKIEKENITIIQNGMIKSALSGTGKLLHTNGLDAAIKTGTAPNHDKTYHGWCIGYTPSINPTTAFCVYINHGTGYSNALPVANEVLKTCLKT
ncbi:MAG: penicillin-binding transpeptidase domain-containing protein [Vampirovibrionia bacterium]